MKGRVIHANAGNYIVKIGTKEYNAKPLGLFRNDKIKIVVGDYVELEINENKKGLEELNIITKLYDRKNYFIRPNISNIDLVFLVTSINEPNLNDYYLDKLITIFNYHKIPMVLFFTKSDLGLSTENKKIIDDYKKNNFNVFVTNGKLTKIQLEDIYKLIKQKTILFVGQTGVGKSTLLNILNPDWNLKTNEISRKLGRGKHTTRDYTIFSFVNKSELIDTPGFSSYDISNLSKEDIAKNFFTFSKHYSNCKFKNCLHLLEKDCSILNEKYTSRTMNNYKKLLNEL